MGFIDALRTTTKEVEIPEPKPQEKPAVTIGDPVDFVHWAEAEAIRISELSEAEQKAALEVLEKRCELFDALPQATKEQALELAEAEKEKKAGVNLTPAYTGPVVLDDVYNPGYFVARFADTAEPVGRGKTQYEALDDLKRQKLELEENENDG